MDFDQTIAAISTAPGVGALAIVRLSGSKAFEITNTIFKSTAKAVSKQGLKSHYARHGHIRAENEVIDEVVVIPYASPDSYTSEDMVEISCHGNPLIARRILALCLQQGARLAQPGEFTQRAFLAGKLDLTQAEAVLDLIQAKTSRSSQVALSALNGDLGRQINLIREELKQLLTKIVASIDFPDEVEQLPEREIESVVEQNLIQLSDLAATAASGKYLREGLKLAIVGRPNAGKSSLLNRLLKVERAIVTDIPGTTRDSLEENLEINGIPITLVDTAGMRSTEDVLEKIGIERTRKVLADSELILLVADLTCGWQKEEDEIVAALGDKPWFLLWNKIDLVKDKELEGGLRTRDAGSVNLAPTQDSPLHRSHQAVASCSLSAKTGQGIDELSKKIEEWVFNQGKPQEVGASLNTRQAALCQHAIQALQLAKKTLADALPHDCLTTDLKLALDCLSDIAGVAVSEEVITSVFANFCLGK